MYIYLIKLRWVKDSTDTGTHFGRSCFSVHGSGWVCPGSGGSRSRPSDMDSGKPAGIHVGDAKTEILEPRPGWV